MPRQLNEQWIEVIDGKKHMLKAVQSVDIGACTACDFEGQESKCAGFPNSVCGSNSNSFIIKDLGVLNEDGLLPCPFCGEYPGKRVGNDNWKCGCEIGAIVTWQQAIDAWNRRA